MITDMIGGFDAERASHDLQTELAVEIGELTKLVLDTASANIRYYPDVRNHLKQQLTVIANEMIAGEVTADYWQAWLEQFGKGSLMASTNENPGLTAYQNSEFWNTYRSRSRRVVVSRRAGRYKALDGTIKISRSKLPGVDLEELAERGDIDKKFGPTPPTFFLRQALLSNKNRIMQGIGRVIQDFPYHRYFR